jgi:undecaprenyl-diphosphatase
MLTQILLALIQAATEFLPVSSSGHLALVSNLLDKPDLFFFTVLHLASLIAVIIFTRKEIGQLLSFDKKYLSMWGYLIIATIPAALFGFFFHEIIREVFSSYFFLAIAFFFTGGILLLTKFISSNGGINPGNALIVGLFQIFALFPGVSRSGMTISSGMFSGIEREKAAKFSFLLLIPLVLGAFIFEMKDFYFSIELLVSFIVCLLASLLFLNLLMKVIKRGKFWMFSIYCFLVGLISLILYLAQ